MIGVFLIACIAMVWFGGVVLLFWRAMDSSFDGTVRQAFMRWAVLIVYIAASVAIGAALDDDDPHANQLCLSGSERWVTISSARGGSHREKQWVCSQWE